MPACPSNWGTLSSWRHPRKPYLRLSAQNGMRLPYGIPSGNRVPESRPRTGHAFRLKRPAETASRNRRSNWDAVSGFLLFRKVHPILRHDSGTQFPHAEALQTKAPTRDGAGAKGAAYAVDVEREQPVNNGCPHPALPAVADAAVGRIHHGQIWTQLAVKRAVGVLYGGRRGDRCDLADALAAICHRQ